MNGMLGILAAISMLVATVKQVTGSINARLVLAMVKQGFTLSKKHGVALLGDLTKGNVEAAVQEATQWFLDELQNVEGALVVNNTTASTSTTSTPSSQQTITSPLPSSK